MVAAGATALIVIFKAGRLERRALRRPISCKVKAKWAVVSKNGWLKELVRPKKLSLFLLSLLRIRWFTSIQGLGNSFEILKQPDVKLSILYFSPIWHNKARRAESSKKETKKKRNKRARNIENRNHNETELKSKIKQQKNSLPAS